jgi:hypothetical protein
MNGKQHEMCSWMHACVRDNQTADFRHTP